MDTGTFRVGPRDYLNQFLSLISTLRGGDSRYLPLLLAKINETMPAMAAPIAHSLPLLPANDRIQETYESSESSDSTPYSSPPVPQATGLDFPDLTNGMSSLGTRSVAPYNCASTVATAASLYYTAGAPPLTGVSTVPTGASLYHAADVPLFTGVSTVPTAASLYHTADAPGFSG